MPFTLQPPQLSDIPVLSHVAHEAFSDDPDTMLRTTYNTFDLGETMAGVMVYWLDKQSDRHRMMKAVDNETSKILGYVTCSLRGYTNETMNTSPPPRSEKGVEGMEEALETHVKHWMHEFMSGHMCMHINSLNVPPAHRAKGVGTASGRWVAEQADQDGVVCTVFPSEAAAPLYTKIGFEEMETLDINLAKFAQEEEEKEGAYGGKITGSVYKLSDI